MLRSRESTTHTAQREQTVRIVDSRLGITLIEVLISMFVLLFGLMGVAAIFPVASHYVLEGDKRDRSSGLAQIAFEELKARKILRPKLWLEPTNAADGGNISVVINPTALDFHNSSTKLRIGHAYVIDPLSSAMSTTPLAVSARKKYFPLPTVNNPDNPWPSLRVPFSTPPNSTALLWPLRRITLNLNPPDPSGIFRPAMRGQIAETAFRLRDDLAVDQPDAGDRPSVQRWSVGTGNQLLSRQYTGDYSWLATVVPTSFRALEGLQPARNIKDAFYEVTTVVFYKRDITPTVTQGSSPGSERLIAAEFLNSSELAIYDHDNSNANPETVDTALDGIKPTNWVAVMGVNQVTGVFMMKWYKIQAMDDETGPVQLNDGSIVQGRYVMVQGADWPEARNGAGLPLGWQNLRVAILPGAIDAYTRVMQVDVE